MVTLFQIKLKDLITEWISTNNANNERITPINRHFFQPNFLTTEVNEIVNVDKVFPKDVNNANRIVTLVFENDLR